MNIGVNTTDDWSFRALVIGFHLSSVELIQKPHTYIHPFHLLIILISISPGFSAKKMALLCWKGQQREEKDLLDKSKAKYVGDSGLDAHVRKAVACRKGKYSE